ncbi:MAG: hypothetical protein BGO43_13780 [Gammaproteobacteria bacterium 39-13]|nr:chemotaxis protein CheW [Gammaproteobacteria bacterium]OJV88947.1 MAG: hypothetical protein BGO43_13780 [Gammaproteobacteria bacterium 39-13]
MEREQHLEQTPFAYLIGLEKAILNFAKGMPVHQTSIDNWVGVSFLTGDKVLLISLEEVVEIMRVPQLAPVPGVKPWLRGMATSRGELFAVTDFSGFLTQKISLLTHESRILVIHNADEYVGILVDRVLGLQRIANKNIKKAKTEIGSSLAPFITNAFIHDEGEIPIIDSKPLILDHRFNDISLREDELSEFEG